MVVNNKTYVVDTMIMLILFTFICIGTIFATSDRFVDSQIMPKWLARNNSSSQLFNNSIPFLLTSKRYIQKQKSNLYYRHYCYRNFCTSTLWNISIFQSSSSYNCFPSNWKFRQSGRFRCIIVRCSSFLYMGDYKIAKYFALDANRYHILNNTSNYIFRITFRNPKCISNSFLLEHSKN